MKCSECGGTGVHYTFKRVPGKSYSYCAGESKCIFCHGTGNVRVSNLQFFRKASKEDIADFICDLVLHTDRCNGIDININMFAPKEVNKKIAMEWLEEEHVEGVGGSNNDDAQ